jgi:predicted  nucleic acid-binding Zn-ribbon protein
VVEEFQFPVAEMRDWEEAAGIIEFALRRVGASDEMVHSILDRMEDAWESYQVELDPEVSAPDPECCPAEERREIADAFRELERELREQVAEYIVTVVIPERLRLEIELYEARAGEA